MGAMPRSNHSGKGTHSDVAIGVALAAGIALSFLLIRR